MPSRSIQDALEHIRDNIKLAFRFTEGWDLKDFEADPLIFYGVTRCLEIISEASRRLPAKMKQRHPSVPWSEMAGAGNIYRHDYEEVEHALIWGTLTEQLPALLAVVEEELARIG